MAVHRRKHPRSLTAVADDTAGGGGGGGGGRGRAGALAVVRGKVGEVDVCRAWRHETGENGDRSA